MTLWDILSPPPYVPQPGEGRVHTMRGMDEPLDDWRRCTSCGEEKKNSEYYKRSTGDPFGQCKECHRKKCSLYKAATRK